MKTVNYENTEYLIHESEGNAARWIMPTAEYYCKGVGIDIGANKREWSLKGAVCIDPVLNEWDAMNIPLTDQDYIFSSHCLEHVKENWYNVLDYWLTKIKVGGVLFLYLPHNTQKYWLPKNNRKHIHSFHGGEIYEYLHGLGHQVFVSGVDANHSFSVICEKKEAKKVAGWVNIDIGDDMPSMQEYLHMKRKGFANEIGNAILQQQKTDVKLDDKIADMRMQQQKSDQELFCNYMHHINSKEYYDTAKEPNKTKAHYMAEVLNMAQRNDVRLDRAIEAAYEAGRLSK